MAFITSSFGEQIAYKAIGHPTNTAIIFAHGWLHNKNLWDETIASIKDEFYCVAFDYLGHGDSDAPPDGDYSVPAQAQRIVDVANALDIEQFILVGFSMSGSITAHVVAELAPQRILKWVTVAGVVDGQWTLTTKLRLPLFHIGQYMPWSFGFARHLFRFKPTAYLLSGLSNFYGYRNVSPKYWRDIPFENFTPARAVSFQRQIKWIPQYNVFDVADKITVPTLIIAAENDKVVPLAQSIALSEKLANAELKKIPECGHLIMGEKFEEYRDTLRTFITS